MSEGRRRNDAHIYSPTSHSRNPRTPPTPAPSEDRLFTDWSSDGSRFPPVLPPTHGEPKEVTPISLGVGDIHEAEQAASHLPTYFDGISHGYYRSCSPRRSSSYSKCFWQPLERPIEPEERIMTDLGTNTSDVVIEPSVGVLRTPHTEANT